VLKIMSLCALIFVGCSYAADNVDASQLPLVVELTLKNAPGSLAYRDIGSLAVVNKAMHPILLETASYRKAVMERCCRYFLPPKDRLVWHNYATACAYVGKPCGTLMSMKEVIYRIVPLSFSRWQLEPWIPGGINKATFEVGKVLPASTADFFGYYVVWHCCYDVEQHRLKRAYRCAKPCFDNCGNAHVDVQLMIGGFVDHDATVHYVLKSDGTGEKQ
jgi:hypothetical protein